MLTLSKTRLALVALAGAAVGAAPLAAAAADVTLTPVVVIGMKGPTDHAQNKADAAIPALPVVVEKAPAKTPASPSAPAPASSRSGA